MADVKLNTTDREIGMFREQMSRITRSVELLRNGKTHSTHSGKCRLEIIEEAARRVDEACKKICKGDEGENRFRLLREIKEVVEKENGNMMTVYGIAATMTEDQLIKLHNEIVNG